MVDWLGALQTLFDPSRVPQLNGRIAILGLTIIDASLREFLESTEFLRALVAEFDEPFQSLLTGDLDGLAAQWAASLAGGSADEPASPEQQAGTADDGAQRKGNVAATTAAPDGLRIILASGYTSDSVDANAVDRLEIEREVQVLAHLLASRAVKPPLSLGLFGDWGTGKSFFMSMLRSYILNVAAHYRKEEQKTGVPSDWCTRVLQIEFNAWHYSDANLWASLVTRIYAALQNELQPGTSDEALKEQLETEVRKAEGVARAAAAQIHQAEKWVEKASGDLQRTRSELEAKEQKLAGMIGNLPTLLAKEGKLAAELTEAARVLGMPQAGKAYDALGELHSSLTSVSGRVSAVGLSALRSKGALPLLALLAVAVPVLVSWIVSLPQLRLAEAGQRVVEISTILVGVVAWLQKQIGKGVGYIQTVEKAMDRADVARRERIEGDEKVSEAVRELAVAQGAQEAAKQNLENSQAQLQKLRAELDEMGLERRLFRLIDERSRSATYSQHLGIISLIREDFETISSLFARLDKEDRDLTQQPPPIQRIILYIDDLDRCPADRVVQVLEAVHMLLAFPLFTVVVGVDPRWLRESLTRVHGKTLHSDADPGESTASYSTPQDYLEKIFQIPFALRRVEKTGYENLVADLIKPQRFTTPAPRKAAVVGTNSLKVQSNIPGGPGTMGPGTDSSSQVPDETADGSAGQTAVERIGTAAGAEGAADIEITFKPIAATSLEFTPQEKHDINALWPLFSTPRGVKRFINTYRLVRASIPPEATENFEGTEKSPGEYQIALLLLAIASSSPNELGALKERLLSWAREADSRRTPWRWSQLLGEIRNPIIALDPDWEAIDSSLVSIVATNFRRTFTKKEVELWMLNIARYTFSVLPPASGGGYLGGENRKRREPSKTVGS